MKEIDIIKNRAISLEAIIRDIFWMARRYAHGRHTSAPSTIREVYGALKRLGITIQEDATLEPPSENEISGLSLRSDYLDDLK